MDTTYVLDGAMITLAIHVVDIFHLRRIFRREGAPGCRMVVYLICGWGFHCHFGCHLFPSLTTLGRLDEQVLVVISRWRRQETHDEPLVDPSVTSIYSDKLRIGMSAIIPGEQPFYSAILFLGREMLRATNVGGTRLWRGKSSQFEFDPFNLHGLPQLTRTAKSKSDEYPLLRIAVSAHLLSFTEKWLRRTEERNYCESTLALPGLERLSDLFIQLPRDCRRNLMVLCISGPNCH